MKQILLVITCVFGLAGCGTFLSFQNCGPDDPQTNTACTVDDIKVYGGVVQDLMLIPYTVGLSIIDLPFSLVGDTVVLPFTIPMQIDVHQQKNRQATAAKARAEAQAKYYADKEREQAKKKPIDNLPDEK